MTPEAEQTIIELLAQVARQNRAEIGCSHSEDSNGGRVDLCACFRGREIWANVCGGAWRVERGAPPSADPAYARTFDLWSQIAAAAKAMEEGE